MKKPNIDGIDPDVQNYIWYLESRLNGYSEFQQELSNTLHVLAEDLKLANNGERSGYKLLSGNKDDKVFERIITLIKAQSQIKSVALLDAEEPQIKKKKVNIQDFVLNS